MAERRGKSRLSARRKTEIVLRVLRGEDLDALSRELRIEGLDHANHEAALQYVHGLLGSCRRS